MPPSLPVCPPQSKGSTQEQPLGCKMKVSFTCMQRYKLSETFLALFINPYPRFLFQPERYHVLSCVWDLPNLARVQFRHPARAPHPHPTSLPPLHTHTQALPHKPLCWFKCDLNFGSLGFFSSCPSPSFLFCVPKLAQARSNCLAGEMVCLHLLKSELCHGPLHTSLMSVSLTGL